MRASPLWSTPLLASALFLLEGCQTAAERIEGSWDMGVERAVPQDRGPRPDVGAPDFGAPDFWTPRDLGRPDRARRDLKPPADFNVVDGTYADGPGCSPANDPCTAPQKLTWSGMTIAENGDTSCAQDDLDFDTETCGHELFDGTLGPDVFFEVTLPAGTYRISLEAPQFDSALYVLTACDVLTCVAASDEINAGVPEELFLQVPTATKYLIGVDSYHPSESGTFKVAIEERGLPADGGPPPDGPPPDAPPTPGKVVITEMMINPAAVPDAVGEWFELYNAGAGPVNLKGWRLADAGTDKHTISSDLFVPAKGYVVLGRDTDVTVNGGAPVAYAYGTLFDLSNSEDEILLYDPANNLVDEVLYTSSWSRPKGASISLKSPALDNNASSNWCEEAAGWTGSLGDSGSPGAKAGCP